MTKSIVLTAAMVGLVIAGCAASNPSVEEAPQLTIRQSPLLTMPEGFVEMRVLAVLDTEAGPAVVLSDALERVLLPIWIGPSEALAISMRLHQHPFERPLTHDLLDTMFRETEVELLNVRIDSVQEGTFVATLQVRDGERVFMIDSRPSDSIALALSQTVSIWVSEEVVDLAGLAPQDPREQPAARNEPSALVL